MSIAPVFAPAAGGRPFAFFPQEGAELLLKRLPQSVSLARVLPASRLEVRPLPEMVPSGIREIDELTGGLPRGCLSEVCGPASSGRTSLLLAALSAATRREEVCALVDAGDAFDPLSAAAAGVELGRLLWVRCQAKTFSPRRHGGTEKPFSFASESRREWESRLEQVLKATDLLLQSGGFGLVAIDLGDVPGQTARRIPLTSWFRFRRAVENTPCVLLVVGQEPCARTCASLLLRLRASGVGLRGSGCQLSAGSSQLDAPGCQSSANREKAPGNWGEPGNPGGHDFSRAETSVPGNGASAPAVPPHAQLLGGLRITAEILRSRLERKPAGSVTTGFATKTAWSG